MQALYYSKCRLTRLDTRNSGRVLFHALIVMVGLSFSESSFGKDWRSDDNVHRILSGRREHAVPMGLLPSDRRLEFSELCILHLKRHVSGHHQLTDLQVANLLGWISRAAFNDAAIYLDALLLDDITSRKDSVTYAIQRSMHEPTRISKHTSIEEIQQVLASSVLRTKEARLALAFALALSDNKYGVTYLRDELLNPLSPEETRERIALTVVGENMAIPEAFEYCVNMLTRDEVRFDRKVSAAYRLMQHGVSEASEWAESALKLSDDEQHHMLLAKGLVMSGRIQYFTDLVELLGSEHRFVAYQVKGHIATLVGEDSEWFDDIRRISPTDLKTQLMELIETKADKLRWDVTNRKLILEQDE